MGLDVARFAESSGKVNLAYPQAWRYRDWVIAAYNADKPYDQFIREQIAGDLLPARDDRERANHQIATGFLAVGSKTHNTQNRRQFLLDLADEQIDATSQAFLGLTVACACCHDHKFDPIPQRDYYAMVGVFESTQTCFGRGLVPTTENFGAAGQPPSHPELLDHLAVSFMDQKWSVKQMIRRIVLSRAYQLSSSYDSHNDEIDPDNALVWRMSKKRLEAEAIRDAVLSISGKLDIEPPVGTPVARAGEGPANPGRLNLQDQADLHRSVYLPVVRDQLPESLALFDFADPSIVTSERATTSGPSQALYLMNSPFIAKQAQDAADRLRANDGDENHKIERAYTTFFARIPTVAERDRARSFLNEFAGKTTKGDSAREAWSDFCQALYAAAEFRYLD